ncbi:MAG TPA: hypothetical protein ENH40_06080 [Nitrospirae bacterium]|nr:hypothetical protein BMS3Bbin08_00056 [bacterium BMS3Bbin08]HDZ62694.1 hypothetical protein [Nitrospirota bacterium]
MSKAWDVQRIAKLLNLSERRVQILADEGILPRVSRGRYDPLICTHAYIRYIKELANGKGSTRLLDARVRTLEAMAVKRETENKVRDDELIEIARHERIIFERNRLARDTLLKIPDRTFAALSSKLKLKKDKFHIVREMLKKEVRDVLSELSNNDTSNRKRRKNN